MITENEVEEVELEDWDEDDDDFLEGFE